MPDESLKTLKDYDPPMERKGQGGMQSYQVPMGQMEVHGHAFSIGACMHCAAELPIYASLRNHAGKHILGAWRSLG